MAVSLTPKFNRSDIVKQLAERKRRIEAAILSRLQFVGEQFVVNARNNGSYTDRTTNLRSSVGYVILKDGTQMGSNFEQKGTGAEGVQKAREAADEVAARFPTGYVLIGVAGMEYAAAVESKSYDVISNSAGIAEESLKRAMQKLADKLAKG